MENLTDEQLLVLQHAWKQVWARTEQLPPPGDWFLWLYMAGRGAGKSRAGAEWVRDEVEQGRCRRVALVARTAADNREVQVEGESGILSVSRSDFYPKYEPSKRRITWPNGAIATTYSAEEPDMLRGPQHDLGWVDEIASWKDAYMGDVVDTAWSNLTLGMRLGDQPRIVGTTTPKPVKLIRQLIKRDTTVITRGSTLVNLSNLAPTFAEAVLAQYRGTRLERQEIFGELLEDVEGALWTLDKIAADRISGDTPPQTLDLIRVVVGVDPAVSSGEDANETGIIVAGRAANKQGYVLADRSIGGVQPMVWAKRVIAAYDEFEADAVIAEVNNGGELVTTVLHTVRPWLPVIVRHASRGKRVRAEPVAMLYEQNRVSHRGVFEELEAQMCEWTPDSGESPDRLDAMVWAFTDLMVADTEASREGTITDTRLRGRR